VFTALPSSFLNEPLSFSRACRFFLPPFHPVGKLFFPSLFFLLFCFRVDFPFPITRANRVLSLHSPTYTPPSPLLLIPSPWFFFALFTLCYVFQGLFLPESPASFLNLRQNFLTSSRWGVSPGLLVLPRTHAPAQFPFAPPLRLSPSPSSRLPPPPHRHLFKCDVLHLVPKVSCWGRHLIDFPHFPPIWPFPPLTRDFFLLASPLSVVDPCTFCFPFSYNSTSYLDLRPRSPLCKVPCFDF